MKKASVAVIGLFLLLYILPLGVRPLTIPDETRYAEIPREMIASGDWVVPHLNGLRYFEKPVLGYWLTAGSMVLFGENAFAIRFPSAMAVGISALMVFFLVWRFAGGFLPGILAAAALLTCLEVYVIGMISILDSVLSLFLTGVMISFFFAYMEEDRVKKMGFLALFGVFCGLAFLAKGFIAFVIPMVAIVPFMIWERQWKDLHRVFWAAIAAALPISLPWAIMIYLREPDFWHYFFWVEHIKRFISVHAQHPNPFWFFIPIILGGALPWTVLLPSVIAGLKKAHLNNPIIRFAICWFLIPFLFFSASHGKLATYILPCFSPLVILITIGFLKYLQRGNKRTFAIGMIVLALLTGIFAVILVLSQVTGFSEIRAYGPSETWKWSAGAIALLVWASLLLCAKRSPDAIRKLVLFSMGPLLFMFSMHFIIPDQTITRTAPAEFLLRHLDQVRPDSVLIANDLESAVCWFYKRDDVYVLGDGGELDYGLNYDDSKHRLLSVDQFKKLIREARGQRTVILITKTRRYAEYRPHLPQPIFEEINGGFVFAQF